MSDSSFMLKVASPCSADWNAMEGDDRRRFCTLCEKHVYNLDGLSEKEARRVLEETAGPTCVRFFQRSDGTVLTSDCPVGVANRKKKVRKRVTVLAFSGVIFAGVWSFARNSHAVDTRSNQPLVVEGWIERIKTLLGIVPKPVPMMGEVCPPAPSATPSPPVSSPVEEEPS